MSTAPGEQAAHLETDRRDDGEQGVAHDVPAADDPDRQALGLGGAHVVLVEHVEDRGSGDPEDDGERDRREGDGGQHEVAHGIRRAVELAREQAVEDEEPRDAGAAEGGVLAPGHREDRVLDREVVLEEEGEEEDGDRHADERHDDSPAVEGGVVPPRRDVAEGDREHHRDQHGRDAELDRRRKAGEEDVERVAAREDPVEDPNCPCVARWRNLRYWT